jgi:hypothetical protein
MDVGVPLQPDRQERRDGDGTGWLNTRRQPPPFRTPQQER